eukprot:4098055-Pleurochrysis_carterae.AAC.1
MEWMVNTLATSALSVVLAYRDCESKTGQSTDRYQLIGRDACMPLARGPSLWRLGRVLGLRDRRFLLPPQPLASA